jgi:nitrate reductase NapD
MNLSSILVFASPKNIEVLNSCLCDLPGIEVHHQCHDTGRLIVIQEALDDKTEMDGLRRIKALPHVMAAEMFYHYVDDERDVDDECDAKKSTEHNNGGGALSWV